MKSASQLDRLPKKRSKVPRPPKKASHRRPHKPVDPPPPDPVDPPSMRRVKHNARSQYNTHNPFDHDIPLHDVTGQPLCLPQKLIRLPPGGYIPAHALYPTREEFSKMHAVKPANRFGRAQNLASTASSLDPAAPSADSVATGSDVASLVDQLKAGGLDPEDEIMLAHLKVIDMDGQFRECYHNAAEACERAETLHPMHVKMVRYRGAMRTGHLSTRDYDHLKQEIGQQRAEEERLVAEEEARRQARREARQREERRLRAKEAARREERRRRENEQRIQRELEEQRARQAEIRLKQDAKDLRKLWEAQQERLLHEKQQRRKNQAIESERRNRSLTLKLLWSAWDREAVQEKAARGLREYNEQYLRALQFEAQERRNAVEQDIARYRAEAVACYESLWRMLKAKDCPLEALSYGNFPLPVFDNALPPRPDAITSEAVAEFIFSPLRTEAHLTRRRQRIKDELRLWDFDRFEADILPMVKEIDREDMMLVAKNVTKILKDMKDLY